MTAMHQRNMRLGRIISPMSVRAVRAGGALPFTANLLLPVPVDVQREYRGGGHVAMRGIVQPKGLKMSLQLP